jgi:hypothetical protein
VSYEFPRGQCDAMLALPREGSSLLDALVSHFLRRCCTVTTRNAKLFLFNLLEVSASGVCGA